MADSMQDILNPNSEAIEDFPNAPRGWSTADAIAVARAEHLELSDDHWELIRALQSFFSRHPDARIRKLHDALDERFHTRGGMRYLYQLLPAGPVAQGCRLAGIKPPAGSTDPSFGSVQ